MARKRVLVGCMVELVFLEQADNEKGFNLLGSYSIDGQNPLLLVPNVGDRLIAEISPLDVCGQVTHKAVCYRKSDLLGKEWDFVTQVFITIERDQMPEDEFMKSLPIQ